MTVSPKASRRHGAIHNLLAPAGTLSSALFKAAPGKYEYVCGMWVGACVRVRVCVWEGGW